MFILRDGKIHFMNLKQEARVSAQFPSPEWLQGLEKKLNSDEKYAQVAKKWEGDLIFFIEPELSFHRLANKPSG